METMSTTFTKLRDGSWGVRGYGLTEGQRVTVTKRSGETSTGTVGEIVFTATDGVTIARFEAERAVFASRYARRPRGCHTDGNCSSLCNPASCPCGDGGWFTCC